jgi:hypothetical protein
MAGSRRAVLGRLACVVVLAIGATGAGAARQFSSRATLRASDSGRPAASFAATAREPDDAPIALSVDDGSFEQALGVVANDGSTGNQAVFLNRFTVAPESLPFTLDEVSVLFPVSSSAGPTRVALGQPFDILVYVDPSGSGVPANATMVAQKRIALAPSNTVFQDVQLDLPIVVEKGDVWVGFTNTVTATDNKPMFPAALDATGPNQNRSWAFFNQTARSHFGGGPLANAQAGITVTGNWLIRASGQAGGLTCVNWGAPAAAFGAVNPPPQNTKLCDMIPEPVDPSRETPRGTLQGYNVYRSNQPGVQPTPGNLFTSVPPGQTEVGSSVAPGGSFFVITAMYDTGESGPSNELAVVPPTIATLKITTTKLSAKGTDFTAQIQVFVDGIPFVSPAVVKRNGTKVKQAGTLLTGETIGAYLAAHGNTARIDFRNEAGGIRAVQFTR